MKDWIMELCPEIQEWQAELIVEHTQKLVESEREACAKVCEAHLDEPASREWNAAVKCCAEAVRIKERI